MTKGNDTGIDPLPARGQQELKALPPYVSGHGGLMPIREVQTYAGVVFKATDVLALVSRLVQEIADLKEASDFNDAQSIMYMEKWEAADASVTTLRAELAERPICGTCDCNGVRTVLKSGDVCGHCYGQAVQGEAEAEASVLRLQAERDELDKRLSLALQHNVSWAVDHNTLAEKLDAAEAELARLPHARDAQEQEQEQEPT